MRLAGAVGEDHLVHAGVLELAGERQVVVIASCVPDFKVAGDLGDVEDAHRDGKAAETALHTSMSG